MIKKRYSLIVVDDAHLICYAIKTILRKRDSLDVLGTATHGQEAIDLCRTVQPHVVVLDIMLPGMNGFAVAEQLKIISPNTKILLFSSLIDPFCFFKIAELNIPGYIDKSATPEHLEKAIFEVASGKQYYAPLLGRMRDDFMSRADAFNKILTPRELSILILIVSAYDDQEICCKLNISPNTLITHRRNLRQKLNAHNDRDLLAYALEWGLTSQKENWIING